jgi:hypothetical protein
MNAEIEKFEAYSSVCESFSFSKLCPRLVPAPLWGLSLANLADMEPRISSVISEEYPALVEKIGRYWMSLDRSGKCEVCGGDGNEIDEEWRYFVFNNVGELVSVTTMQSENTGIHESFMGIAYLEGLRLLCSKCHAAKHLGRTCAQDEKKCNEAINWLQKVNGLNNVEVEQLKQLIQQTFFNTVHAQLSRIKKWSIRIELAWPDNETQKAAEKILNHMYSSGFRCDGSWLCYSSPSGHKATQLAEEEAYDILDEMKKSVGEGNYKVEEWVSRLLEILKDRLKAEGIYVLEEGLRMFIRSLLNKFMDVRIFEVELVQNESFRQKTEGKWIVKVPNSLYEKIFCKVVESLENSGLAYRAAILCEKGSINKSYLPIIVHAPTSFALRYISSVAEVLKRVLNDFGLTGGMMTYKPNVFTEMRIRSEIYRYCY